MNAPDFDQQKEIMDLLEDEDVEDSQPSMEQKMFQSKIRQEMLLKQAQATNNTGKKVSSLQMMKRCRYKAGANTKQQQQLTTQDQM